ncbi:hypothetical protein [Kytococcus sp. Marseille-QA3725]
MTGTPPNEPLPPEDDSPYPPPEEPLGGPGDDHVGSAPTWDAGAGRGWGRYDQSGHEGYEQPAGAADECADTSYPYDPGAHVPVGPPPASGGRDWTAVGCIGVLVVVASLAGALLLAFGRFDLGGLGGEDPEKTVAASESADADGERADGADAETTGPTEGTGAEPEDGAAGGSPGTDPSTEPTDAAVPSAPSSSERTRPAGSEGTASSPSGQNTGSGPVVRFGEPLQAFGAEITVSEPRDFTPSGSAAGVQEGHEVLVQDVTVTNNHHTSFSPRVVSLYGVAESQYVWQVYDSAQDVGPPSGMLAPGESVTYRVAWSVPSKEGFYVLGWLRATTGESQSLYWSNGSHG